jgi:large subunit ribosomal protein L21
MYAVIKTGGQQFRVEQGTTLKIEKLEVNLARLKSKMKQKMA